MATVGGTQFMSHRTDSELPFSFYVAEYPLNDIQKCARQKVNMKGPEGLPGN